MLGDGCWVMIAVCCLFSAECWLLIDVCRVLDSACVLLSVGCWLLGVGCWVLVVGCWVLGAGMGINNRVSCFYLIQWCCFLLIYLFSEGISQCACAPTTSDIHWLFTCLQLLE